MRLTKEELQEIKQRLPDDYCAKIADETGYSKVLIYNVINGKRQNVIILDKLIEMAKNKKK